MSGKTITLTENEAISLNCFIRDNFIESIKNNPDIDSLLYIYNIMSIYEKCGGLHEWSDYDDSYPNYDPETKGRY